MFCISGILGFQEILHAQGQKRKQKHYYEELMSWSEKMNVTTFFLKHLMKTGKKIPVIPWGLKSTGEYSRLIVSLKGNGKIINR